MSNEMLHLRRAIGIASGIRIVPAYGYAGYFVTDEPSPALISTRGREPRRIAEHTREHDGRVRWTLASKTHTRARVVCYAFHGPPPSEDYEACHLDGDPTNDHPRNLAWGTKRENRMDMHIHAILDTLASNPDMFFERLGLIASARDLSSLAHLAYEYGQEW